MTLPAKPFYMIRHGETEHNKARILAGGIIDSKLTQAGRDKPKKLAPHLSKLEKSLSKIFHSSMTRARDTATYLNDILGVDMEEVHDLREQEFGEWEGKPSSELTFSKDMEPPGGENVPQFKQRAQDALTYCLDNTPEGDIPLVVCHGGFFFAMGVMYDIYEAMSVVENSQLYLFEPDEEHPYFPWKVTQFVVDDDELKPVCASFCSAQLPPVNPYISEPPQLTP